MPITHSVHGSAIIRDQKLLIESRLRTALQDGITPPEKQWGNPPDGMAARETFVPAPSGVPVSRAPKQARPKGGRKNAVAELTVEHSVPDIREFGVSVSELGGGLPKERIWP